MKRIRLLLFFIGLAFAVSAQNLTKEKLPGKWRITHVEKNGVRMPLADEVGVQALMFAGHLGRQVPGKATGTADSVVNNYSTEMLSFYSGMLFTFNANGTYTMLVEATMFGVTMKEEVNGRYTMKKNRLVLRRDKEKEVNSYAASMPDDNTIVLTDFGKASVMGMNLVLTRQ